LIVIQGSWVSSPKEFAFPETIPEEASSVEDERVVIFRLPSAPQLMDNSFFTVSHCIKFLFSRLYKGYIPFFRPMPACCNSSNPRVVGEVASQ